MATPAPVSVAPEVERQRLGDAEVGHHDPAPGALEQDVVRLDVAMDDRERMGGAEGVGRLRHDAPRLVDRQLAPPPDPPGDRFAVHVAHDEVDQALAFADGMDGDDMGVGQPGGRLGLAGEPLADVLLKGELGRQHLDGDPALEPLVARPVDHAHPATPDLALDGIGIPERLGEARRQRLIGRVGHETSRLWGEAWRRESS